MHIYINVYYVNIYLTDREVLTEGPSENEALDARGRDHTGGHQRVLARGPRQELDRHLEGPAIGDTAAVQREEDR